MDIPSIEEAFKACHILFGAEISVSIDFLKYLQPSGIKSAYWKKAWETHPDRARGIGEKENFLTERFKEINLAYELLSSIIKGDGKILVKENLYTANNKNIRQPKNKPEPKLNDHYYSGQIPGRILLIGQFLYYSGKISWKNLLDALIWQRRQRPLIGQIALNWGILSREEIQVILKDRQVRETFGECAIRKGLLTPFNILALLGKQNSLQCRLGEYFIKNEIIRPVEMEFFIKKLQMHNKTSFMRNNRD